ncbi:nicotinamidase [Asaia krungthepensis]|uniref:nicotinamidase n=1 Tax=Asaia krungthepensis NRIC 0535 TaxID=1307925 RepID=A0ABQ0Q1Z2_9PROT|nr:nicotinamidase [Asaia krungthepensis]GBQ87438.1 nicotinamidase [Asaia krungthepensis NRIC 0535]
MVPTLQNPARTALIIVDVQNDFLPGGALAVPKGDLILPPVNQLVRQDFAAIIATRDWHPAAHVSFISEGGPWPVHCVAGTAGADFPSELDRSRISHIIHKGLDPACDSYSGFFDNERRHSTGLNALLRGLSIEHVVLCGLALDFCVNATARDALKLGFTTTLIRSACRGIAPDDGPCLSALRDSGVTIAP